MLSSPKVGQKVQIWYHESKRASMPYHGKIGTVAISGKGKPRNHLVDVDGCQVVVPCGNIRKV